MQLWPGYASVCQHYATEYCIESVIRLQGNESSDTQTCVGGASDDANTDVDSDAAYDSDTTQEAFADY